MAYSNGAQRLVGRWLRPAGVGTFLTLLLAAGCTGRPVQAPAPAETTQQIPERVTDHAPVHVSAADYTRAESFLGWNAVKLVDGLALRGGQQVTIQPTWVDENRFWYDVVRAGATRFVFVDPVTGTSGPAFDHDSLAAVFSEAAFPVTADSLPFTTFQYGMGPDSTVDLETIHFVTERGGSTIGWTCDMVNGTCTLNQGARRPANEVPSPDGRYIAVVHANNLWVKQAKIPGDSNSIIPGDSVQATHDGQDHFGYGLVPQGCCDAVGSQIAGQPMRPYVMWSPDSKKIVMHKYDERAIDDLYLLETAVPRPILHSYRYALPGDPVFPSYELYVYDLEKRALTRIEADSMVDGFASERLPVQWSKDSDELFFTRHTPDYQEYELMVADSTGATSVIVTETDSTFVSLNTLFPFLPPNWRIIRGGSEAIWFSERSGWGHLYRYNVEMGELINQITAGDWLVLNVEDVDDTEGEGWVYFTGLGREPDRDPYLALLYRARLDGSKIELLTPDDESEGPTNHATHIAPSRNFILDTHSRRDHPGRTVIRNTVGGDIVMEVEQTDISRLVAEGWQLPVPFTVKARDSVTELHGFLHFPSNFDETKEYPVVDFIYPGPQIGPILSRSFSVQPFGDPTALAELGFIVFAMDAMGTPQRSKPFNDFDYGDLADAGLPDHIAALKQLDSIFPQIDLDRVGIYGHSGGGAAAAAALLNHGEFFKVGVAGAGNHDNRSYDFAWGNKYQGLLDGDNYDDQANQLFDGHLEGNLLITYGTLDDNVHPNNSLLLIDALIRNNENFDVLVLPNRNHFYMTEPYAIRRGWDYFVTHLLGADPPWEYKIKQPR